MLSFAYNVFTTSTTLQDVRQVSGCVAISSSLSLDCQTKMPFESVGYDLEWSVDLNH